MSALHYLSWLACAIGFIFVLLSLASGLLYVAEVIEEHSGLAKTVGKRLIYAEIGLYCLLYWVDDLPIHLVALGIAAHLVYLGNFSRSWPVISLTSISFILSCVCVLASHFLSFRHFSARTASHNRYTHYNAYNRHNGHGSGEPTFLDIATFFAVCVWLVPFYLFLSLSANDNVLPSSGETPAPSRRQSAVAGAPSSAAPTISHQPASPALSSAPSSPNLSRHTRQRSSMMKSALSSAFSIVPSSLRPSTLSSQLPLLSAPGGIGQGQGARNDLPRSPSPTFGFRPYEGQPAFSSALSLNNLSALGASSGPSGSTSPKKPAGWGGQASVPTSPTSTTTGLGFSTATLPSGTERGSGGALASPSLTHSTSQGRMLNFSPSPQPSPSAASFPHSPSTPSFYSPPPGQGFFSSAGGGGGGLAAPGMARRHTTEQGFVAPPVPLGERRASEAVVTIGGAGGAEAGGAYGGPVKRRGPGGAGGGGGGRV